jgi:5-(carboxyamino)imidazole ribonucleotide synthase
VRYFQPNSGYKVCILGGGQLGWMMILEGRKFPITFLVYAEKGEPACRIADLCFKESYEKVIEECDIVTFEFEHVDEAPLQLAEDLGKLLPRLNSVVLKRARHLEKEFLQREGFPVPRFVTVEGGDEALRVLRDEFNNVGVVKKSEGGYDGRGQYFIRGDPDRYQFLREERGLFVVEELVNYDFEASIIAVRSGNEFRAYPPTFNYNEKGILVYNYGPYGNPEMIRLAEKLTEKLNYVGVMGIEFFIRRGKVMINEYAPRVHNTGHYTLDGAEISQFEHHLRAITGMELGETRLLSPSGMVNLLGVHYPPMDVLRYGSVYWYGKEVRRRRKVGHVNVVGKDLEDVRAKIENVMKLTYPNGLDL